MLRYFGYGSNINLVSLKAKGVVPYSSVKAVLNGWKLVFNVRHWFRHEGGVGNIMPSGNTDDHVEGLMHTLDESHLSALDLVESYGVGYDRIEVDLNTKDGHCKAVTYVGLPGYLNDDCLPTQRYLNIIIRGAKQAGLSKSYLKRLINQQVFIPQEYPQFEHPTDDLPIYNTRTLQQNPHLTALGGAVFDMRNARKDLDCLKEFFGGKDMTLFHLKRLDTSDGKETIDDIRNDDISENGKRYINAYLNEYMNEYQYAGRYEYD